MGTMSVLHALEGTPSFSQPTCWQRRGKGSRRSTRSPEQPPDRAHLTLLRNPGGPGTKSGPVRDFAPAPLPEVPCLTEITNGHETNEILVLDTGEHVAANVPTAENQSSTTRMIPLVTQGPRISIDSSARMADVISVAV